MASPIRALAIESDHAQKRALLNGQRLTLVGLTARWLGAAKPDFAVGRAVVGDFRAVLLKGLADRGRNFGGGAPADSTLYCPKAAIEQNSAGKTILQCKGFRIIFMLTIRCIGIVMASACRNPDSLARHPSERISMHYSLLFYLGPEHFANRSNPEKREAFWASFFPYMKALQDAGIVVGGAGLQAPEPPPR